MIVIKTPDQLEHIRKAGRVVAEALKEIEGHIEPGITTEQLDKIAENKIRELGATPAFLGYRGYRFATCMSVNNAVVHGLPNKRPLEEGDILGVDIGARMGGFCGDAAKTFAVGQTSKKIQRLLQAAQEALLAGIDQAVDGKRLGEVSAAIEKTANKYGFSVVKDLFGHGIGKDLHEDPLIPNFGAPGEGPVMKEHMVFAIEPMLNTGGSKINLLPDQWTIVTADGGWSAHFEHTVIIKKGAAEIITCLPQKM